MRDAGFQPAGPSSRGRRCLQHAWPGAALALRGAPSILSSPRGRVVLGGRPTCGAARREAPSQLFGTSDPDGMFHVPHTLRIRRTIGISDEFGRSAVVPRVGVCQRSIHGAILIQSPMAMARAAPRGPGTVGVGCVPYTVHDRCRRCAWSNLESDLAWAVSGHGNGVTADGCHRLGRCQAANAAVTQRSSTVVRAPSLGGRGHDMLARFKLKCGLSCQGGQGSGTLARSHSRLLASRANGRAACSPMFGACFPCPPLSTTTASTAGEAMEQRPRDAPSSPGTRCPPVPTRRSEGSTPRNR